VIVRFLTRWPHPLARFYADGTVAAIRTVANANANASHELYTCDACSTVPFYIVLSVFYRYAGAVMDGVVVCSS